MRGRTLAMLASILEQGPRKDLPPAGAKVCQACGELGTWDSAEGRAAGHVQGGDFVAFSVGHALCASTPFPAYLGRRPFRFCEICRTEILAEPWSRRELNWVCGPCGDRIDSGGHDSVLVLDDLALRRFAVIGGHRPHRGAGAPLGEDPRLGNWLGLPVVPPPAGWLPEGLRVCETCGEARGTADSPGEGGEIGGREALCICSGPACRRCGRPRSHRPISDSYERHSGTWLHTSYVAGFRVHCDECEEGSER